MLPILAINFAVWKYRLPARAARTQQTEDWLCNRIIEIARQVNKPLQATVKKKKVRGVDLCPSIAKHDALCLGMGNDAVIAYTDGSALGNPGPCGAGVSIFLRNPDLVIDAGVSLGYNTNNYGELVALLICLRELAAAFSLRSFTRALICSDSAYAIRQILSSNAPQTYVSLIMAARKLRRELDQKITLEFLWVRGHAQVGGNLRADFIAKQFARNSRVLPTPPDVPDFLHSSMTRDWSPGHPLVGLPSACFTQNISINRLQLHHLQVTVA